MHFCLRSLHSSLTPVPRLAIRLAPDSVGQVGAAVAYYSIREDATSVPVKFLLLFDSRTGQLVSPEGVLVIDTPPRGAVANFGGVQAVYAGTG